MTSHTVGDLTVNFCNNNKGHAVVTLKDFKTSKGKGSKCRPSISMGSYSSNYFCLFFKMILDGQL